MSVTNFVVNSVEIKPVNTKYGMKNTYTLQTTIGKVKYGWKDPRKAGIDAGTALEAVVNQGQYGAEIVDGTVKVISTGNPVAATPAPAITGNKPTYGGGGAGAAGRPFPVPKTSGELAIIRQNALTNAVAVINNYGGELDAQLTLDEYTDKIIEIAYKFADFTSGQREVAAAKQLEQSLNGTSGSDLNAMIESMRKV